MATDPTEDDAPPHPAEDTELPEYSARIPAYSHGLTEHTYQLDDSKGRPWIWLTLKSRSPVARQLLLYSGDEVTGNVQVDFDLANGAKGVSVATIAGVTAVGQEELGFLNISHDLWNNKAAGSSSKPRGKQSWSFSIALPSEATLPDKPKGKSTPIAYPLPPSFSERASPAYVDYRVVVTVRRGAFRGNQLLSAALTYLPVVRAEPPSHLRQVAYSEGSAILGPEADPEGWKVLPPVKLFGKIFDTRSVELECTLAIASPLSYARGSPVPVNLTLAGSDKQALDLLAAPSAVNLHLVRARALGEHATNDAATMNSNTLFREVVGSAYLWPATEGAPEERTRTLQGELALNANLKPSFVFPTFSLRYTIALFAFQAPGFSSAVPAGEPLLSEKIVVTSAHSVGPAPRSYAPPGYKLPEAPNYNISVGYLENGNQRFYHHGGGLGIVD
ncbi:hypothetical protein B0H21DRAFT_823116 [Amylocystis lapponica]|nr:hypothetical protein B0H21DRAFT_823116 [Amylocystis lapponica]